MRGDKDGHCMDHSGCEARISQCERNDEEIFPRLREIEKAVWQAGALCGFITSAVVLVIQHYWK